MSEAQRKSPSLPAPSGRQVRATRSVSKRVAEQGSGPYAERSEGRETGLDRFVEGALGALRRPLMRWSRAPAAFVAQVEAHSRELVILSNDVLAARVQSLARDLRRHGINDSRTAQAFALVREVAGRVLGMRHHRVQLLGGYALMHGHIAEMATGEGKSFTAALAAATAALAGIPVHVVTVNDYLAERDGMEMGVLYDALGLSVGVVKNGQSTDERSAAYLADITYCTNKELGFDYLRDQLALPEWPSATRAAVGRLCAGSDATSRLLLRGLHFAIVDEADSVLVDEARTPLVISRDKAAEPEMVAAYGLALAIARELAAGVDFTVAESHREVRLTPMGQARVAALNGDLPSIMATHRGRRELIGQALSALHLYERDTHYLVREGKVQIVDEFTGRTMADRSWERGLHQIIEMKEQCEVTGLRETLARITYQRFFRKYVHLCGMTGTAAELTHELWAVYRLRVTPIATHKPCQRRSFAPRCLPHATTKWAAVLAAARIECEEHGRPVLIGTRSVAASEAVSARQIGRAHV